MDWREERKKHLEDNVRRTLELVKEYEDKRRLADDPKEKAHCDWAIADLRYLLQQYFAELEILGRQPSLVPPPMKHWPIELTPVVTETLSGHANLSQFYIQEMKSVLQYFLGPVKDSIPVGHNLKELVETLESFKQTLVTDRPRQWFEYIEAGKGLRGKHLGPLTSDSCDKLERLYLLLLREYGMLSGLVANSSVEGERILDEIGTKLKELVAVSRCIFAIGPWVIQRPLRYQIPAACLLDELLSNLANHC